MFDVNNVIAIRIGNLIQGNAEGPLGIAALLVIVAMVLITSAVIRKR